MNKAKISGLVVGILVFLLMNFFDRKYLSPIADVLDDTWTQRVFGIDITEEKKLLDIKFITVNNDGDVEHFITRAKNPEEALLSNGYALDEEKRIDTNSPADTLLDDSIIVLNTYRTVLENINISIPYEKIVEGGSLCETLGTKITLQKGVLGVATQTIEKVYVGNSLVSTKLIDEEIISSPRKEILLLSGPNDSPDSVEQIGYNCGYWEAYIDSDVSATDEEKQWLKFTMRLESGCNAESDKHSFYKGLFQWSPCQWYKQFPSDNIFDGKLQIKRTLQKLRAGANPKYMWPAAYKRYVETYGELSWLSSNTN